MTNKSKYSMQLDGVSEDVWEHDVVQRKHSHYMRDDEYCTTSKHKHLYN